MPVANQYCCDMSPEQKIEQIVEDCRFAKVVSTARGPALMIAGHVIEIQAQDAELFVKAISIALRRGGSSGETASPSHV